MWLAGVVDTPEFTGSIVALRGWECLCLLLWLTGLALVVKYGRTILFCARSTADLLERSGVAAVNDGGTELSPQSPLRYSLSPFIIGALIPAGAIYLGMLLPTLILNLGGAF